MGYIVICGTLLHYQEYFIIHVASHTAGICTLPTNLLHGPTFPALLQMPLVYSLQLDRINVQLTGDGKQQ